MGTFLGREPVAIAGFIAIVINLGISFGLKLTVDQVALINAAVVALLALIVRSSVTAPANLVSSTSTTTVTAKKDNG